MKDSLLVLVLLRIGQESAACFRNQSRHKAQLCKTSAGVNYFGIEKQKLIQRHSIQSSGWEVLRCSLTLPKRYS